MVVLVVVDVVAVVVAVVVLVKVVVVVVVVLGRVVVVDVRVGVLVVAREVAPGTDSFKPHGHVPFEINTLSVPLTTVLNLPNTGFQTPEPEVGCRQKALPRKAVTRLGPG